MIAILFCLFASEPPLQKACEVQIQFLDNRLQYLNHLFASEPPLSDLTRFPCQETCEVQIQFLDSRLQYLNQARLLFPDACYRQWFFDAISDAQQRKDAWDILHVAHYGARSSLRELKILIGDRDYGNGQMPAVMDARFLRP